MLNLPTTSFGELFHVGTLDIRKKSDFNYESTNGLSVSTEPEAWCRINRGGTFGDTFTLSRLNNAFIDYHAMSNEQYDLVCQWGVDNGYIKPCKKYQYSYFDDEFEQTMTFSFFEREEADENADGEHNVTEVDGFKAQEKFTNLVGARNDESINLIVVAYCMAETDFDGVYWHDKLDVLCLSAPRGVILQNKLADWCTSKVSV
jgi:hypothetical protein